MRVAKTRLVLVLNLTGREDDTSFMGQSQSEVKQNLCNLGGFFDTQLQNCLTNDVVS